MCYKLICENEWTNEFGCDRLLGTSDNLSQKHIYFQVSNNICIHNTQSMHFPYITYGMMLYINTISRTKTNIEKMYVYASERSKRG